MQKLKTKSERVSEFRRNRKANLLQICGNKCCLCGYDKIATALEFHHINPALKEYGIASNGTCHNIHKDIAEIKKCVLVCANCHREIHEGLYTQEELYTKQFFNEEIIKSLTTYKKDILLYCSKCNTSITKYSDSGLCVKCSYEARRKSIKPRPSREELKELIQKESFVQIGKQFGVTDNAVRKWCVVMDLPSKKADINKITDWSKI